MNKSGNGFYYTQERFVAEGYGEHRCYGCVWAKFVASGVFCPLACCERRTVVHVKDKGKRPRKGGEG